MLGLVLFLLVMNICNITFAGEEVDLGDILDFMKDFEEKMVRKSNEIIDDGKKMVIGLAFMLVVSMGVCLLFSKIDLR